MDLTSTGPPIGGVMDLSILECVISERNLPFKIGQPTPGRGSCFLEALKQNFQHFNSKGLIEDALVPKDVPKMREDTIRFMLENKSSFVGGQNDKGEFQPGPLTDESFAKLISDQSRENAYTDLDGWFILYSCKLYKIELQILQTDIRTPILSSGVGGPLVSINKPQDDENEIRPIFYMGLIKNQSNQDGHYQFIYKHPSNSEESTSATRNSQLTSPIKLPRSRLVRNYLKTPSPKKRPSDSHCFSCKSNMSSAAELENHLSLSARCQTMYLQTIKNKNLSAFLVSLNPCFFCQFTTDKFYLSVHLKKNQKNCLQQYFRKYSVNTLKDVMKKVENIKKTLPESRSRAKRRIETKKLKEKKSKEDPKLTVTDLINQFRRETALTNVRQCLNCNSNLSESRAEEVKKEDLPDNISEKLDCRRFQKWFICGRCKDKKEQTVDIPIVHNIKIQTLEISGTRVFVPQVQSDGLGDITRMDGDDNVTHGHAEDTLTSQVSGSAGEEGLSMEKCLYPCNIQALALFSDRKIKPRFQDAQTLLYKVGQVSEHSFSLMFENELHKYYSAVTFGDKFTGEVKEGESRLLASAERVIMDGVIVGSDTWKSIERRNKIHRFELFGSILCSFSVLMPVSPDIVASSIIQTGVVITLDFKADGNGELQTEYRVHDHKSDKDCDANCESRTLQSFLSNHSQFEEDKVLKNHLMTYLSNVQLKMNSFVRNFLKNEASPLHAADYTVEFEFQEDGLIKLQGFIWPKLFEELNVSFASYPQMPIEKEVKERCVHYVDSLITSSSDPATLKVQFNLSEAESNQLSLVAESKQFHFCQDSCSKCKLPSLPSLETIFVETPSQEDSLNIETAMQFKKLFLSVLKLASEEEVKRKSSAEWLHTVFLVLQTETEVICGEILRIKAAGSSFDFIIDERLKEMMVLYPNNEMAAYHYSISCGELSTSFGCVIKRLKLADCFTQAYNVGLLKTFNAPMSLKVVNGHDEMKRMTLREINIDLELGRFDELKLSHNVINLTEAATLFDRHLSRSNKSTTIEFVNTVTERKSYFKKVSKETDTTFKCEHSGGIFERTHSNIERYFARQNGKYLTLMEFVSFYDYCGQEDSRQLLKIFVNPATDIQSSTIRSASSEEECLPEFIVSNSADVMKLRNSRKVVAYPCYDDNPSKLTFAKVLLFYPHKATTLDEKDVLPISQELDESGSLIVERNERFLLPKKNHQLCTFNV